MKQTELKKLVKAALASSMDTVKTLKGCDNPQILTVLNRCKGKATALRAVLDALNGDRLMLNLIAEK